MIASTISGSERSRLDHDSGRLIRYLLVIDRVLLRTNIDEQVDEGSPRYSASTEIYGVWFSVADEVAIVLIEAVYLRVM